MPVDAISCHTTYVKNGSSSCLYDIHDEIGTTKHILPIILYYSVYQNIKKTRPFDWLPIEKSMILVCLLRMSFKYFNVAPLPELIVRPQRPLIPKMVLLSVL